MESTSTIELETTVENRLYVVIPPSPLFAAHWSIFIPDPPFYDAVSRRFEEPPIGRRIHVTGDRLNGFHLEIIRQYDVRKHRSASTRKFPIGLVMGRKSNTSGIDPESYPQYTEKDEEEGGGFVDNDPKDQVERVCVEIPAPGPSLNRVGGNVEMSEGSKTKRKSAEVKDCQWWVRKVVEVLSEQELLRSFPVSKDSTQSATPCELVTMLPVH